jgi:hypothetical protein
VTDTTQIRQQLLALRHSLKLECASLETQLEGKKRRLDALEVLLAEDEEVAAKPVQQPTLPGIATEEGTATEAAKAIIKASKTRGVWPREITKGVRQKGHPVANGFASNLLWKLRTKTREVVEHEGRNYWKGFEPEAARS